jgi:DNA-binding NarL/FixJ family response regulator
VFGFYLTAIVVRRNVNEFSGVEIEASALPGRSAEILAAVDAASSGLAVLDPRELETLLAALPPHPANGNPTLTARELEVLRMMAEGDANKAIAWKLNISEHTAKFHVASILSKLNASTRTEAATMGIRRGLILL